jgi:hypothetical protein
MDTKTCSRCGEEKPCTLEFFPQRPNRRKDGWRWDSWCRLCYSANTKKIQLLDPERKRRADKEWRERNSEAYKARRKVLYMRRTLSRQQRQKEYARTYNMKIKLQAVEAYGGQCECCAETMLEFLTIDHKNRDGKTHRRDGYGGGRFYQWLIREGFPQDLGLRVLCMNCNWAACWSDDNTCPHERFAQGLVMATITAQQADLGERQHALSL